MELTIQGTIVFAETYPPLIKNLIPTHILTYHPMPVGTHTLSLSLLVSNRWRKKSMDSDISVPLLLIINNYMMMRSRMSVFSISIESPDASPL